MRLSSPIYTLKRQAKLRARETGIKLHEALKQIAIKEGFKDWSHLASAYAKTTPAADIMRQFASGDLVLIAARPGHGKTLLGLEMAGLAKSHRRKASVFSLNDTDKEIWDRLASLGVAQDTTNQSIVVDTSDDICAGYITQCLDDKTDDLLVVVDYLQLLDQRRSNPSLEDQVQALKTFAIQRRAIVVLISQIDRGFQLTSGDMPSIDDVRLPNPVDVSLFDKWCFLHDGAVQLERFA